MKQKDHFPCNESLFLTHENKNACLAALKSDIILLWNPVVALIPFILKVLDGPLKSGAASELHPFTIWQDFDWRATGGAYVLLPLAIAT